MTESGRFVRYNSSHVIAILRFHIQKHAVRNELPMCCCKGKHGIVGLQRAVYDGVMATEAFASLAPEERPSVERFTDKVKILTDLAKVVFEIPRGPVALAPTGPSNSGRHLLNGFQQVRTESSLERECGLKFLEENVAVLFFCGWMEGRVREEQHHGGQISGGVSTGNHF
jgi:hypothetical protein